MTRSWKLYDNKYELQFHEGTHRYNIDGVLKEGVTGILGSTLAKEGLMLWPLDEALRYLFGQKFTEIETPDKITVEAIYSPSDAFLQPNRVYTHIELEACLREARNAHITKRDKGADIGKIVHQYIEHFLTDGLGARKLDTEPRAVQQAFGAFMQWYEAGNFTTVLAERPLYSEKYDYCGTADHLFEENGKLIMNDFKTSNYSRTAPMGVYAENFAQVGAYSQAYYEEFGRMPDDTQITNISKSGKVNTVRGSQLGLTVEDCVGLWLAILQVNRTLKPLKKQLTNMKKEIVNA